MKDAKAEPSIWPDVWLVSDLGFSLSEVLQLGSFSEQTNDADRPFVLRIHQSVRQADEKDIRVAANSREDLSDWHNSLLDCIRQATDKVSHCHLSVWWLEDWTDKRVEDPDLRHPFLGESTAIEGKSFAHRQRAIELGRLLPGGSIQS